MSIEEDEDDTPDFVDCPRCEGGGLLPYDDASPFLVAELNISMIADYAAEIDRLREALRAIVDAWPGQRKRIAEAALREPRARHPASVALADRLIRGTPDGL